MALKAPQSVESVRQVRFDDGFGFCGQKFGFVDAPSAQT